MTYCYSVGWFAFVVASFPSATAFALECPFELYYQHSLLSVLLVLLVLLGPPGQKLVVGNYSNEANLPFPS